MTREELIKEMADAMALPMTVKHSVKAEIAIQIIEKYYDLIEKAPPYREYTGLSGNPLGVKT